MSEPVFAVPLPRSRSSNSSSSTVSSSSASSSSDSSFAVYSSSSSSIYSFSIPSSTSSTSSSSCSSSSDLAPLFGLDIVKDGTLLEHIALDADSFLLGRQTDVCDIVLAHMSISRQHARLQRASFPPSGSVPSFLLTQGFSVTDLASTHGTFLNHHKLEPQAPELLHVGDQLRFGESTRIYVVTGPEEFLPPEDEAEILARKEKILQAAAEKQKAAAEKKAVAKSALVLTASSLSWKPKRAVAASVNAAALEKLHEVTWSCFFFCFALRFYFDCFCCLLALCWSNVSRILLSLSMCSHHFLTSLRLSFCLSFRLSFFLLTFSSSTWLMASFSLSCVVVCVLTLSLVQGS